MTEHPEQWNDQIKRQRDLAFDAWLLTQKEFFLLPANRQDVVRKMLRKSFQTGSNWQRARHRRRQP